MNNSAGLYNVRQMMFNLNLDTTAKRALSCDPTGRTFTNVRLTGVIQCDLRLNLLTKQPSAQLSSVQNLPYHTYSRMLTSNIGITTKNADVQIVNNTLTLNQIPEMIYVAVRKPLNSTTIADSNSFWPIKAISVNFNNVDAIFSGASMSLTILLCVLRIKK